MGGLGSGRGGNGLKALVDEVVSIDAADLLRRGAFARGATGMTVQATAPDGDPIVQQVEITTTNPHFGGVRYWLTCPSCSGRARRLFLVSTVLECVRCANMAYPSQSVAGYDWLRQKAQAIRIQLGASANLHEPFPARPKGMHRDKYARLWAAYLRYEQRYLAAIANAYGMLRTGSMPERFSDVAPRETLPNNMT